MTFFVNILNLFILLSIYHLSPLTFLLCAFCSLLFAFSFLLSPFSFLLSSFNKKSRNSMSCGFIVDEGVAYSAAGASVVARFIVTLS